MRRNAFGATNRPPLTRPGNGYGRPGGRPGPLQPVESAPPLEPTLFCDPIPVPMLAWTVAKNLAPEIIWEQDEVERVAKPVLPPPRPIEFPSRTH